jgi:hypothetical protein
MELTTDQLHSYIDFIEKHNKQQEHKDIYFLLCRYKEIYSIKNLYILEQQFELASKSRDIERDFIDKIRNNKTLLRNIVLDKLINS